MLGYALRAGIMYFLALIMVRLLGKRALGELGPFDFVVMTGVGHTVVSVALDKSIPFYEGIVILSTLAVLEYMMGYVGLKNQTLSNLIVGKPVVLIDHGTIHRENLRKEKFNVDDLMQELRKRGIRDLTQVERGILESCGGFSVILTDEDEPVTRGDLGLPPPRESQRPTLHDLSRRQVFDNQAQPRTPYQVEVQLPQVLNRIEERLENIAARLQELEQRGASRSEGL